MDKFIILADSVSDLSEELRKRFDIEYIPAHMTLPDGTERTAVLEWTDDYKAEDFYKALSNPKNKFTTAPANIDEYAAVYEKFVKDGYGVLSISLSSALSGTYDFACLARKQVLEKYPDAEICCIDSLRFSAGAGLLSVLASKCRERGLSLAETAEYIEQHKNRVHQMGWLDDLSFVAAKGNISKSAAFFGTLIGIKPLGDFDETGMTTILGKVKGEKTGYAKCLRYIEETIENPAEQTILVATTARHKQAAIFADLIRERIQPKEVIVTTAFPSCAINVGSGLMAAYYVGKPASPALEEEKKLMSRIIAE